MLVGAIGSGSYQNSNIYRLNQRNEGSSGGFAASIHSVDAPITLHWTNQETGEKALTSVGFPGGGGASVFKSENYSEANPEYRIKYWEDETEASDIMVNPKTVNPMNASYLEMLGFTTYSDIMGYTSDGFGNFISAARGVNGDISYDLSNIMKRMDYKAVVSDFMDAQYNAGNISGYMSLKRLHDYMDDVKQLSDITYVDKVNEKTDEPQFKEVEIDNYKLVPEPGVGKGGLRIFVNGESAGVFSADDLKIRVAEKTGTRVLVSELGGFGGAWYGAIPVDSELEQGLREAIGEDEVPVIALEGYYIGTHAETGIKYFMRNGDEGRGGRTLLCNDVDRARYQALGEEYARRYPDLIGSAEEGMIYADFEIRGMAHRTANGIVMTHPDNISYNDNSDPAKNWSAKIDKKTWDLMLDWLSKNKPDSKEMSSFKYWDKIFGDIGGSYERIWSDDEISQGYLYQ